MKPFGPPRALLRSPKGVEKFVRGGILEGCLRDGWVIIDHPLNVIPEQWEKYREGAQEQPTERPKAACKIDHDPNKINWDATTPEASPKKRGRPKGSKNTKTKK